MQVHGMVSIPLAVFKVSCSVRHNFAASSRGGVTCWCNQGSRARFFSLRVLRDILLNLPLDAIYLCLLFVHQYERQTSTSELATVLEEVQVYCLLNYRSKI